jgi:hypothetical protein
MFPPARESGAANDTALNPGMQQMNFVRTGWSEVQWSLYLPENAVWKLAKAAPAPSPIFCPARATQTA